MLIGQSYRLQNNDAFQPGSGLENKLSDIVGISLTTSSTPIALSTQCSTIASESIRTRRGGAPSPVRPARGLDWPSRAQTLGNSSVQRLRGLSPRSR